MERSWSFIMNPFINATRTSYRKMKQLGDYTIAGLSIYVPTAPAAKKSVMVDSFFADRLAELTPVSEAYNEVYAEWLSQQGISKGHTQSFGDLIDDLSSTKIADWDLIIQNVYRKKTPQYTSLFPRGRIPFQSGGQQERISAVGGLSLAIGTTEALQNLKTEVDTFYDELVLAHDGQKGNRTKRGGNSSDVEEQRLLLGIGLYGVLGRLMDYFKETPEMVSNFFFLTALQNREQTVFKHGVNGGETYLALTRTFVTGDELLLTNCGNDALQVALVHEKTDAMPSEAFTLQANQAETVPFETLGISGNRFLIIKNMNAAEKGAYTIDLL